VSVGYSGTPLPQKLGIKEGTTVLLVGAPSDFGALLGPLPEGVRVGSRFRSADVVLVFARDVREMEKGVARARTAIPSNGAIWLCWQKKASGVTSELQSRTVVMGHMEPLGLVDVKVAAISEEWSGLKFVIRRELR
jgi:hypothetical protein